ncbi:Potassium/sodium hyperpolarization-activated cyclic nucleotide-gated channel 4 [Phytophthora citrophthora]|uniref:Potassium/sodium hyperpolarization-activated cyclic nucleotide-gated channel 4 n=1 Tax=Phytophthora citrophthora TaxID=4793 RepID=A0AAD9LBB4_9STRA|nr:Potassium/sodium hyperpolarization-activated cyclic nucleotide-gated channel 4 [Phytophthora citrophthora]
MLRSESARDVVEVAAVEAGQDEQPKEEDSRSTEDKVSSKLLNRLKTTSAVAAALAQVQGAEAQVVERPKRRRLDRRHSGGNEPPDEAEKLSTDPEVTPNGHRMSAPAVDTAAEVVIKPMRGNASPRGQLKRATSTHLAGIRERLKAKQAEAAGTATIKRTASTSATPIFKRTPSSSTTPAFRAVAKAVAGTTTLTSSGNSTAASNEQGQNYEQMMARFQLRRLETTDSNRSIGQEAKKLNRRSTAYLTPVDSEMSHRRMDDIMNSTRPRSEGDQMDDTTGRGEDRDPLVTSQSRVDSHAEESPRRAGAPSFQSIASVTPPASASVTPAPLGSINGVLGGSLRSMTSTVKNPQSTALEQEPSHPKEKPEQFQPQSLARRDSGRISALDHATFHKLPARTGNRPRPLPRSKKRLRNILARLRTPLSPFSRTARVRSFLLLMAFCVHTLGFPYEEAFHSGGRSWYISIDSATEMIFFTDFVLAFNTSFVNKRGVLVVSRRHIAWNFLTGSCFFQFIAALPSVTAAIIKEGSASEVMRKEAEADAFQRFSHTLLDILFRSHRIVHILRLLREVGQVRDARIDKSVLGWLLYSRYSHLLRIVWIVGAVMLIAHCVACCWRLLLLDSAAVDPSLVMDKTCGARIDATVEFEVYAECFYVAMQMLQGQSLTTHSTRENVFASFVNLLGSIVLAVIFGHVAMLVANFNANSTAYQRKMESVFAGMTKMQLPAPLRERIHQYYAHLWREYEALDGAPLERFAKELSHNLTLEVVLFKYMELAMHVPFWENCSPDFQKTLVLSLDTRVYLPDDFIVRRGEVGDEFYMINRGLCELVGSNDTQEHATEPLARRRSQMNDHNELRGDTSTLYTTSHDGTVYPDHDDLGRDFHRHSRGTRTTTRNAHVSPEGFTQLNGSVKTLTRGQALGEMALLMNYQRTANVRAMTYVEMCVLSRTAFQAVLTRYPADRKHVISQILISSLENNERFGIPCPLTAMVRSVFAGEVDDVENGITPRRAAKLVASAVNPDVDDDSIKFALSAKLKEQLVIARDLEFGVPSNPGEDPQTTSNTAAAPPPPRSSRSRSSSASGSRKRAREDDPKDCGCTCNCNTEHEVKAPLPKPKLEPEVESQALKLETAQAQTLVLLQELQREVQETLPCAQPPSSNGTCSMEGQSPDASLQRRRSITRGASTKTVTAVQQRRISFIGARSTSAPNLADLLAATAKRASEANGNESLAVKGEPSPKEVPKAAITPPSPIQRARTTRWLKTTENTRPLREQNSFSPLVRPRRGGSSSQRFIQRVTSQLASLTTSSNSTPQTSPTRYADQLFRASVKESYREDSNISEYK